jgi:hypothetical protein
MQKRAFRTMLTGVGRRSGRGERPGRLPRRSAEVREEDGVAVDLVAWEDAVASRRRSRRPWRGERERGVEAWSCKAAASARDSEAHGRTGRR